MWVGGWNNTERVGAEGTLEVCAGGAQIFPNGTTYNYGGGQYSGAGTTINAIALKVA